MKKFIFLTMVLFLVLPFTAFASPDSKDSTNPKGSKDSKTQIVDQYQVGMTKNESLTKHAEDHNIPLKYKGKKLYKVEYEYAEKEQVPEEEMASITSYRVTTVDYGHGWYNSSDDLIHQFVVDGPDTFKISKTEGHSSEFGGNFGAGYGPIEAAVNFKYNTNYSITMTSNTPVSSGETLVVNIYKTFLKKKYNVYNDPWYGSEYLAGSSYAYKPTGTYLQKTFYR